MSDRVVECGTHGKSRPAFVCSHLVGTSETKENVGINFVFDEDGNVNAWCDKCEDFVSKNGDEWNDETEAFANIQLACDNCFLVLKTHNTVKDLN